MTVHVETPAGASRLYERVARVIPPMEWPVFAADIDAIVELKKRRGAVILAHNYQTPEIFHCVADFVGDSLALAREAATIDAGAIVMAGVHFMAETAKLVICCVRRFCSSAEMLAGYFFVGMRKGSASIIPWHWTGSFSRRKRTGMRLSFMPARRTAVVSLSARGIW